MIIAASQGGSGRLHKVAGASGGHESRGSSGSNEFKLMFIIMIMNMIMINYNYHYHSYY